LEYLLTLTTLKMKKKMTISELRTFIQEQAVKLYVKHLVESKENQEKEVYGTSEEPCPVCGSHKTYAGPETGGWTACANCGTI
jgi:hypothetical protein